MASLWIRQALVAVPSIVVDSSAPPTAISIFL
jgi:hypothetical protein